MFAKVGGVCSGFWLDEISNLSVTAGEDVDFWHSLDRLTAAPHGVAGSSVAHDGVGS